jgi:hypothetical protein
MLAIQAVYKLKNDSIDPPETYLVAGVEFRDIMGTSCWTMSSEKYVKAAIDNVNKRLAEWGLRLQPKCPTPMTSNYRPELDSTVELNDVDGALLSRTDWGTTMGCGARSYRYPN